MGNEKKHYCFNCRKYDAFYTKEETRYKITTDGYCSEEGKIKDHKCYCELWCSKPRNRIGLRGSVPRVLRELLYDISALKQILEEQSNAQKQESMQ